MTYEPCDQCEAPLDEQQRYCVVCGASRRHATDPLARYLAAERGSQPAVVAPPPPSSRDGRWTAAALALLPVAAAIGVLVGRGAGDGEADVVAALRAQKAPIVQVGGSGTASSTGTAAAAAASITSDFSLPKGFVVKLRTLPKAGTDAAAVAAAKRAARAKGAAGVGIIDPADFTLRPSPDGGYLLYSGEFKTKAAADKALGKLKKAFPSAAVIAVTKKAAAATSSAAVALQQHATAKQKSDGAKVVQEIQRRKGKSYIEQQRNLPDTIVVP